MGVAGPRAGLLGPGAPVCEAQHLGTEGVDLPCQGGSGHQAEAASAAEGAQLWCKQT